MAHSEPDPLSTRASLLGRIRNWDDAESWEEFAQTYSRLIRGVAIQAGLSESEAQDVEQETLLSVAKTIHEFESNPQRGTFKGWLLNLTRWRIADQFRKRRSQLTEPFRSSSAPDDRTSTVERVPDPTDLDALWETEWKKNLLSTALERIGRQVNPRHAQIFDLYALRHWPAAQVARELGINLVQVYLVHHRMTKLLRREIAYLESKLK
jgi:RNA polymerase sigma-70 factor (ECF subfamily)